MLERQVLDDVAVYIQKGIDSGEAHSAQALKQFIATFGDRFAPENLRMLDGVALLNAIHGRQGDAAKTSLVYWLEFKNDEEFAGRAFGSISGGSALKFGFYQSPKSGAWITGPPMKQQEIEVANAVALARQQRDQLIAGAEILSQMSTSDLSDAAYSDLQSEMQRVAPDLAGTAWAHKYWFLLYPDVIDDYHSPRYQRFHLIKLMQEPPDGMGVLNDAPGRFRCAGRFISAARELDVPVTTMNRALNLRHGTLHHYWRVHTRNSATATNSWEKMHQDSYIDIGLSELADLSEDVARIDARARLRTIVKQFYHTAPNINERRARELINFCLGMQEKRYHLGLRRAEGDCRWARLRRIPL